MQLILLALLPSAMANQSLSTNAGHIFFEDKFVSDGNLSPGNHWSVVSGNWSVKNGVLTVTHLGGPTTESYILAGDSTWTNYCVAGQVSPDKHSKVDNDAGILLRVNSEEPFGSRYTICLNPYKNWIGCANDRGPKQWIGHAKFHFVPNTWYSFVATVRDSSLDFSIDGRPILHCEHLLLTHGKFGLEAWNHGTQKFLDIRVMKVG
ncbi:MAG TPA: family 16 glycoside hydrolase [Candidatus Kapabacteria bacterium]|nr:family 16 glycoside hydrolase [Candidatus Kapabacteria bacterium]